METFIDRIVELLPEEDYYKIMSLVEASEKLDWYNTMLHNRESIPYQTTKSKHLKTLQAHFKDNFLSSKATAVCNEIRTDISDSIKVKDLSEDEIEDMIIAQIESETNENCST